MNQLVGKDNKGNDVLTLFLEPGNLHKLKQDEPIYMHVEDLYPDGIPKKLTLQIAYTDTPVADAQEITRNFAVQHKFDERAERQKKIKPHCPECRSTIEQLAVWKNESPIALVYCVACGCAFGLIPQTTVAAISEQPAAKR